MSWDISIQRFNRVYTSVEHIPNDEQCVPLGSQAEVRAAISQVFSGTDWSDPAWGIFQCAIGSVEFNMGKKEPSEGFALHVRASSQIVEPIIALCRAHAPSGRIVVTTQNLTSWGAKVQLCQVIVKNVSSRS